MSDEEYKILVTDLCSRLPHGVKVRVSGDWFYDELEQYDTELKIGKPSNLLDVFVNQRGNSRNLTITPYLRPMSSMTEEERNEMKKMLCPTGTGSFDEEGLIVPMSHFGDKIQYDFMSRILEWLNARHFDHNGLIAKGLAIEVNEFFNPYK